MRFRPNLVTLEGRDVPAIYGLGTLILPAEPAASAVVLHGQRDMVTTIEHDDAEDPNFGSLYGLNNTSQSGGDVNGDGRADVIAGATVSGHVKVFDGPTGQDGLVDAAEALQPPHVKVFSAGNQAAQTTTQTRQSSVVVDLAVPETEAAVRAGSVYTVTFGGSLLG